MRFWVRVPVLSLQMTEALPSVSTAGSFRMIAPRPTIRLTPSDSTMVTIAGSPSGIAETANETLVMNISMSSMPSISPTTNTTAQAARAATPSALPSFTSFCCSGVWLSNSPSSSSAMRPTSVAMPVAVTTARARPYWIEPPE